MYCSIYVYYIITWLNNENLEQSKISSNKEVNSLLRDIIYEFVDNDYLKNRSNNNSKNHKV